MGRLDRMLASFGRILIVLGILGYFAEDSLAQSRQSSRKSSRTTPRIKETDKNTPVADRIVLRDGKELLGHVVDTDGDLTVLARREWVRAHLSERMEALEAAEAEDTALSKVQRETRLRAWRNDRPTVPAPNDRITAWLERELSGLPEAAPYLMAIQVSREDVKTLQKRSVAAGQALRSAWLLNLKDPETTALSTLTDAIAGKGMPTGGNEPVAIDRLLPLSAESNDQWLLRRAATEVVNDEGLRFIQFANTILPEPRPGQALDPSLNATMIESVIKDVLGVGRPDALAARFKEADDRGRVGLMVTRIVLAQDLGSVAAESTLYFHSPNGWERGLWRSGSLNVGDVPPVFVNVVGGDPQVKSLIEFVDSIGMGLISPEMRQAGLTIGTTVGGATIIARTALTKALMGVALDIRDGVKSAAGRP